ncbi:MULTISPECIES: VOC family protein [Parafrankia]|uniref:VOC family protein n=1 Tax=Parafrankia TaxID=2994362 RepID=UPI001D009B9E|nr:MULTISPECIES: VOC family protein [Parafrankia]
MLNGLDHVAVITGDTERLIAFYAEVFDATVRYQVPGPGGGRISVLQIGPATALNIYEIPGNTEARRQAPMFGRGRLDHLGLRAASRETFDLIRDRLIARDASDGFVTDFGPTLSLFFRDPDGLEAEVCVPNPAGRPGVHNPPGTPAPGYQPGVPSRSTTDGAGAAG